MILEWLLGDKNKGGTPEGMPPLEGLSAI